MEKLKKVGRIICIFIVMLLISIFPTLLRNKNEIFLLFQQPKYWLTSIAIAAIVTFIVEHSDDSDK